jgi:hypothetical protein
MLANSQNYLWNHIDTVVFLCAAEASLRCAGALLPASERDCTASMHRVCQAVSLKAPKNPD